MINVNALCDPQVLFHDLTKVDEVYTIYYDETNNIRKLHITPNGLNVSNPQCFVLGGIAHKGTPRDLDFEDLRLKLKLPENVYDMKLKHLGKGGFLQLLEAEKTKTFLFWLIENNLFIHFSVMDPLYWSIVDIIDSIVAEAELDLPMEYILCIKNDLHTILMHNLDHTIDLFKRYTYPNVGSDRRLAFICELQRLLGIHRDLLPDFNFQMLKGVLEAAEGLDALPFLEDEKPNVLIDGVSEFYMSRFFLFKNSAHIFDEEKIVEARIAKESFHCDGHPLKNYEFVNSAQEEGIQISDCIVGLLGKGVAFANSFSQSDLKDEISSFSAIQKHNLKLIAKLLDDSIAENKAFAHYVLSLTDISKCQYLFEDLLED